MMGITVKLAQESDKQYLVKWLSEPGILRWFPMITEREVDDAATCWMGYVKMNAVWMVEYDGVPCGIANLYLHSVKKLMHQSLFAVIVAKDYRNKGVGTVLLNEVMRQAKERFRIEVLHLEVYEGNPAKNLYERLGFVEYGFHERFLKEPDGSYLGKYFMQKFL